MEAFGPGSEGVSAKLLDDLAVDPSGESRLSWDIAIGEAIHGLKELQRYGGREPQASTVRINHF